MPRLRAGDTGVGRVHGRRQAAGSGVGGRGLARISATAVAPPDPAPTRAAGRAQEGGWGAARPASVLNSNVENLPPPRPHYQPDRQGSGSADSGPARWRRGLSTSATCRSP